MRPERLLDQNLKVRQDRRIVDHLAFIEPAVLRNTLIEEDPDDVTRFKVTGSASQSSVGSYTDAEVPADRITSNFRLTARQETTGRTFGIIKFLPHPETKTFWPVHEEAISNFRLATSVSNSEGSTTTFVVTVSLEYVTVDFDPATVTWNNKPATIQAASFKWTIAVEDGDNQAFDLDFSIPSRNSTASKSL